MDKKIIKELEELFTFSSPDSIRQSLQEVFFSYLIYNKEGFPLNYESGRRFLLPYQLPGKSGGYTKSKH